jgi:alkaline phosphatase
MFFFIPLSVHLVTTVDRESSYVAILILLVLTTLSSANPSSHLVLHPRISSLSDEIGLSIILMIGDGMGPEQVELGRLVEKGESGRLNMQSLTWNASATTHSADSAIADSAASATAMATGNKTNNGFVGVNPQGVPLVTIVDIAQSLNKSTGVVTTTSIQHGTPAPFMAHVENRNDYYEISRQIVEDANVDVVLGGGLNDLTSGHFSNLGSQGYTLVYNRTELLNAGLGKLFGIFDYGHLDYEQVRDFEETPSLMEMTNKSLEILSQDPDGFFLIVEGGRIDHAGHANNRVNNALETIAFDNAIGVALDYVQEHENTILLITADHETGGLSVVSNTLNDELPSESNTEEENRALRITRALNVTVDWSSTSHTGLPVPLFCYGSLFESLSQDFLTDNTEVFHIMNDYFMGNPLSPTPMTTTTTTTPLPTTTTTTPTTTTSTTSNPDGVSLPDLNIPVLVGASLLTVGVIVVLYLKRR